MRPETPEGNQTTGSIVAIDARESASTRLSKEEWREALAAYHDGATAPAVARHFGITAMALYKATRGDGKRARKRATAFDAACHESTSDHSSTGADTNIANTDTASRTRDALRASVSREAMIQAFIAIGQGLQQLATTTLKIAGAAQARVTREGLPMKRRQFTPEIWEAAKRDYQEGDYTAGEIAERYGMMKKTVETRAWRFGWSKTVKEAPRPLLPHPDPEQVDANGATRWAAIAHPAQCEPPGKWSTWLF